MSAVRTRVGGRTRGGEGRPGQPAALGLMYLLRRGQKVAAWTLNSGGAGALRPFLNPRQFHLPETIPFQKGAQCYPRVCIQGHDVSRQDLTYHEPPRASTSSL